MEILPVMLRFLVPALLFASCSEDAELKLRSEAQTLRILELESRLAVLRERMSTPVSDRAADLEAARRSAEKAGEELRAKEAELLRIQDAVALSDKEFEVYKRKYKKAEGGKP